MTLPVLVLAVLAGAGPTLRVGLVGLDTSHVVDFTELLNDPGRAGHVEGARITAAFRGGSPDVEASATRIDRFTDELRRRWKVEIVPSIEQLVRQVDAVMITSVDGRTHLAQARRVLPARKPTFIDKPMAASAGDAAEILRLSRQTRTPIFSASSLRYAPEIVALGADAGLGRIVGAFTWGPAPTEPHHPDLFWYGVHAVEMLYTLLGPGCVAVARVSSPGADVVAGRWRDGRLGTVRGVRDGARSYGAVAFGVAGVVPREVKGTDYRGLLVEVVNFFHTGTPPVAPETTVEIMSFMQAAELSKARAGAEVPVLSPVEK
jgi:Oxidoreductase family, NAD-binding Rossmann fold